MKVLGRTNRSQWKSSRKNWLQRERRSRLSGIRNYLPQDSFHWILWIAVLHLILSVLYGIAYIILGAGEGESAMLGFALNAGGVAVSAAGFLRTLKLRRRRFFLEKAVRYIWIFVLLLLTFGLLSTGITDEPVGWLLSGVCVLYDGLVLLSRRAGLRQA